MVDGILLRYDDSGRGADQAIYSSPRFTLEIGKNMPRCDAVPLIKDLCRE